ncbi:sugar transporter [Halogranum salarium B-1]|uniref:Sugar transporter n=2 Tax=Halogranum rubrum TaxID=553466 RepID=J2ZWH8_9EURY|nr:sugar transporter [Halogranum salarium B-1]
MNKDICYLTPQSDENRYVISKHESRDSARSNAFSRFPHSVFRPHSRRMTSRSTTTHSDDFTSNEPQQKGQSTWGIVAGASLISTGLAAYEIVPASVTPLIRDSLHIGPTIAGFLVGIMFGTAVIASLPAGAVLDRTDSRNVMALAVLTLIVAGTWGWIAGKQGDYRSVIASRALGGVAYVIVWNAGIDLVSQAATSETRATAVGIFTASGPIGFALGQGTGPLIAHQFGWPAIFVAFTGLTVIGLVVFWPASRGLEPSREDAPSVQEFGAVLRNRKVWSIGLLGFLGYSLYLFVNSWGASYLTAELGLSLAVSGLLVAVFPAIGVVSRISSGLLSDRVFGGRRQPIVLGSFAVSAPLVLFFTRFRSLPLLVALLLLTGFAVQLTLGLSFTYVREVVDSRVAATAVAFQTSVGLAGAFLAPIAGGVIVDLAGFDTAFLLAGLLAVCGIAVAWRAPEPGYS